MQTVEDYIKQVPAERLSSFKKLRETILSNIPKGFVEQMSYGMIGYVVPHSLYPKGYHCDPKLPLPFANLASQKGYIALHHMGLYADTTLLEWFTKEYTTHCKHKLDIGKGCVRFKRIDEIPYELVGILMQKISMDEWIKMYEEKFKPLK